MPDEREERRRAADDGRFMTTHWSVVLAAGAGSTSETRKALAALCEAYWFPLYAFVRRSGYESHDAEELTQEFFTQLIEKHYLGDVQQDRGRFRSFLLATMKHFLSKQRDRARAQKRGGGRKPISLDLADAEARYVLEPQDQMTAERLYQRRWALTLLDRVLAGLRAEYAASNREAQFDRFQPYLTGAGRTLPYRQLADELAMNEGAVKVAIHRLRKRYRILLRAEIASTLGEDEDVEDELSDLFLALSAEENS